MPAAATASRNCVRACLARSIVSSGRSPKATAYSRRQICNAVVSGNTTMTHLLLGLNPEYIRLEPYTPTLLEVPYLNAADVGIEINPESWVYISPSVGSYVGGDITAGLLCTDLAIETEGLRLFIDIGTNGEIVVGNDEVMMTCACSAGPAFEGGGIGCGMRAAIGAIERVEVDPQTGVAVCSTIGNTKPKGICGSGMISLLAELFLTGWLDAAGKFDRTANYLRRFLSKGGTQSMLSPRPMRPTAAKFSPYLNLISKISFAQRPLSIRPARSWCSSSAVSLPTSKKFISAAASVVFWISKKRLSSALIPDLDRSKFQYIGNSSLMGSYMVLVSDDYRLRQLAACQTNDVY